MAPPDTKRALGDALKARLEQVPLHRVTVTELTDACGLTRKAFYYHFRDVRDLAVWVFKTEVSAVVLSIARYDEWADGLLRMMRYMQTHRESCYAVVDDLTPGELQAFLFREMRQMTEAILDDAGGRATLPAVDRDFIVDFYTLSVLAVVMQWLARGMREDPYRLVGETEFILRGAVAGSVARFARRAESRRPTVSTTPSAPSLVAGADVADR